jgi:hypothetical protein
MDDKAEDRFTPLEADQDWDAELARDLVGATLFVGITIFDNKNNLLERDQVFGILESVAEGAGITLIQTNGEPYVLAPVLDAIEPCAGGTYQLSEDHELVEDPDYVMWVDAIRPPIN